MVIDSIERTERFEKARARIKDSAIIERVQKQIIKIIQDPEIGKPVMYNRKGTRELYVPPFRLSYAYIREENRIILLNLYHKDEQ